MTKDVDMALDALRSPGKSIFFYRDGDAARLMAAHGPWADVATSDKPTVLILPPLAEEMNRCRRVMSLTQQALADLNIPSLLIDYYGTGDSAGDFSEARLSYWRQDVLDAYSLIGQTGAQNTVLLGFRFGAALALHCADKLNSARHIYAVAPPRTLHQALRQFIRIASLAAQTDGGAATTGVGQKSPAQRLENGEAVNVGGYVVTSQLYHDLAEAGAAALAMPFTSIFVRQGAAANNALSKTQRDHIAQLSQITSDVRSAIVEDAPFWAQGMPEEPGLLPNAIAALVAGNAPIMNAALAQ